MKWLILLAMMLAAAPAVAQDGLPAPAQPWWHSDQRPAQAAPAVIVKRSVIVKRPVVVVHRTVVVQRVYRRVVRHRWRCAVLIFACR